MQPPDLVPSAPRELASSGAVAARVLAVIPALNEERYIESCLRSLLGYDARTRQLRVVVVDGGSTDATRDIVRALRSEFPQVELLDNPRRLQSAAVNLAARHAGGDFDILVRCDAHSAYPPGFIMAVADSLVRQDVQSLVVPMDAVGTTPLQRANAWIVDTKIGSGGAAHRGGRRSGLVDHGHHAGFRLDWFQQLGGYDESFTHNEDAEYDYRCRQAGGRIWLDADIRVAYFPRATPASLWNQYQGYGRGRARNLLKHATRPGLRQLIPPINLILLSVSGAVIPFHPSGWVWPGIYSSALLAAGLGIAVTRRSSSGLLAGVALAVMHNAWAWGFLKHALVAAIRHRMWSSPQEARS